MISKKSNVYITIVDINFRILTFISRISLWVVTFTLHVSKKSKIPRNFANRDGLDRTGTYGRSLVCCLCCAALLDAYSNLYRHRTLMFEVLFQLILFVVKVSRFDVLDYVFRSDGSTTVLKTRIVLIIARLTP